MGDVVVFAAENHFGCFERKDLQWDESGKYAVELRYHRRIPGIHTMTTDGKAWAWVAFEESRLLRLDLQDISRVGVEEIQLPTSGATSITALFADEKSTLWIGTTTGLARYSADNGFQYFKAISRSAQVTQWSGEVAHITRDLNGAIWFGSASGKVYRINEAGILTPHSFYLNKATSASKLLNCLFFDHQGNIWIGTEKGAINLNENNNVIPFGRNYLKPTGNDCDQCRYALSFTKDKAGDLLVGTDGGGLFIYDKNLNLKQNLHQGNGLQDDVILSMLTDSKDITWVGTYSKGIFTYDPRSSRLYPVRHLVKKDDRGAYYDVRHIREGGDGRLWIATNGGGVYVYNRKTGDIKNYRKGDNPENAIASDFCLFTFEDSRSIVWIGTYEGLSRFDSENNGFTNFRSQRKDKNSISSNWVYCMEEDQDSNLWIGTETGLNKMTGEGVFKQYFEAHGLPGDQINAIVPDKNGYLWLSTNNGVVKFDPLKDFFLNFEESEGLQHRRFIHGASFEDRQGKIHFGGVMGFNAFHPDSIRVNSYIPKIVLAKFMIDHVEMTPHTEGSPLKVHINEAEEVTLAHDQSSFSIEFAALNYVRSERNRFAYILEGFDKNWNYVETNRPAIYTNLDPGKYRFKVIGSNDFGVWNAQGKELTIVIRPAWWATWWARALYLLLVLAFLYFLRRYTLISVQLKNKLWMEHFQKQKSEELHRLKVQFFANISHELRTPLSLIAGPLERLAEKVSESDEIDIVRRNMIRLQRLVDQLMDFEKIESDKMQLNLESRDIVAFLLSVLRNFRDIACQKNITLLFESDIESLTMMTDQDKMEKILFNLLSNAFKYTSERGKIKVSVFLSEENHTLCIAIEDTGKGIDKEDIDMIFERFYTSSGYKDSETGTGIGLHLTHKLVELLGGKIFVESEPGEGTKFTILLPLEGLQASVENNGQRFEHAIYQAVTTDTQTKKSKSTMDPDKKLVLVIDDNIEICNYLEYILEDEYNVVIEVNSRNGKETALAYMPDLIISDVMMPDPDGIELCRQIKNDIHLCHIPVILLTAKTARENHILGYETGADDYIRKPFDDRVLISRIKNLIRQRKQLLVHYIGSTGLANDKNSGSPLDKVFINNIMQAIRDNYKDPDFSANAIIENSGMSRSVFYKKFKALSDQPINDLIKNFRLKRAEELLLAGNLTIGEVAYATGFNDPAYFSKVFKEHFGISPRDFSGSKVG